MVLSFIGMSGSGKTHWSQKLAERGFRHICCDSLIEEKLRAELTEPFGHGVHGVAKWMGWPGEETFREREAAYMACETRVMREVLQKLNAENRGDIVIDTTGSVVYTGCEICGRLRESTTVVYLEAGPAECTSLIQVYLQDPKPVVWGTHFSRHENETRAEAIRRCYPQLLASRRQLYEAYAHVTLPMALLRESAPDGAGLLSLIRRRASALA